MYLEDLAKKVGAKIYTRGRTITIEINRVYAGDRISDLLSQAAHQTLLVTNLTGGQTMQVAQLMDIPGICLLNGITPDSEMIKVAIDHQTLLMVSPFGMFETCGRLYRAILEEN